MRIGIDISQVVYEGTGVARYVRNMVVELAKHSGGHTLILFGSSWGLRRKLTSFSDDIRKINPHVTCVILQIPLTIFEFLWNRLHIIPIEWIIGSVDIFWSSDWIQPPLARAKGVTTIHDLSIFRTRDYYQPLIRDTQKRRLRWARLECSAFLCDSKATLEDVKDLFHIESRKMFIVYPGIDTL